MSETLENEIVEDVSETEELETELVEDQQVESEEDLEEAKVAKEDE